MERKLKSGEIKQLRAQLKGKKTSKVNKRPFYSRHSLKLPRLPISVALRKKSSSMLKKSSNCIHCF